MRTSKIVERLPPGSATREALGMVDAMPAQEPDATAVLEGQDPPAVDLLLVDRLGDQRGEHRGDLGEHGRSVCQRQRPSTGLGLLGRGATKKASPAWPEASSGSRFTHCAHS